MLQGLQSMQIMQGFNVAEAKRVADENLRIKIGLDNVATNVDCRFQHNIIYMPTGRDEDVHGCGNRSAQGICHSSVRQPCWGSNIDIFSQNPRISVACSIA